MGEKHKYVPFASRVQFDDEEITQEFWYVRNGVLELAVDGVDSKHGVLAHGDVRGRIGK